MTVGELFVRLAQTRAHPTALLELRDELHLVWANTAAVERLGGGEGPLRARMTTGEYARWEDVCRAAIAASRVHELDAVGLVYTLTPLGDGFLAIESRKSDARFDMLFSQYMDGVFFASLDEPIDWAHGDHEALLDYVFDHLRITAVNDEMCRQYGEPRERLIGSVPRERYSDRATLWREHMRQLYDQGQTHHSLRALGRYVEGVYVCTYDTQGRITGHYGTQRDVTEERHTASALVASQQRLELAIETGDIGVWDYDPVTRVIQYDRRWYLRLGYDPDTTPYTSTEWWATKMHPADYPEFARSFRAHVRGEAPFHRVEHRVLAANGEWMWFLTSGKIIARNADGRPTRFVGTSIDITERKLLQDRLAASERMASIGTLAAGVGHEINNPLTYIMLNLELLYRELQSLSPRVDRMRTMVDQTRYGTERVRSVVRDLQALTRAPEDRLTRIKPIAILERCLEIAHHQIKHRATVIRDLAAIPCVLGNEGRMVQLFLNLIVNAAQAIPEGAVERNQIRIATSTDRDGRALVEISDTGAGIPSDLVSRIFDPFFTTKAVGEGTGLGLAICRTIAIGMGGDIEVDTPATPPSASASPPPPPTSTSPPRPPSPPPPGASASSSSTTSRRSASSSAASCPSTRSRPRPPPAPPSTACAAASASITSSAT